MSTKDEVTKAVEAVLEREAVEAVLEREDIDPDESAAEDESHLVFDTSEEYAQVFGDGPPEFDSWEEFSNKLVEFSRRTGFYFKPRSANPVDYVNEKRRVNSPIPDRFVYAKVKMICIHYGDPPRPDNGHAPRKDFEYVAKGCEAFMQINYNKGVLKIGKHHLIHRNHSPRSQEDSYRLKQFRTFNFNDDIDMVIAREVLRNNPFEVKNGEKRWIQIVDLLKAEDKRMDDLTPRLIKKRIRFLMDKFVAISRGRTPAQEDELGNILFELQNAKKDTVENPPGRGKKRKRSSGYGAKLALSKKFALAKPEPDDDGDAGDMDDDDLNDLTTLEEESPRPYLRNKKKYGSPSVSAPAPGELNAFLSYLRRKDEEDRKVRQEDRKLREQELELNKEDLAIRKQEMDLQRQRFEFEKYERKAHLDLLKGQLQVLEKTTGSSGKDRESVEYTILVDDNPAPVVKST